jgi:two-component system, chemotaxis family, response regulator Rcp1
MGQPRETAAENERPEGTKAEILLAEDSPADVYLIREALRTHGLDHKVHVVADGQRMLQLISTAESSLETEDLALIILDLNLPLHDGIEILRELRVTAALAHVPVVVLTSSDSPRDRILASELGADCYLRKPSSLDQFLNLGAVFKGLLTSPRTIPGASQ